MATFSKRIESSYAAYLRWRAKYKESGYGLDRELTLTEYSEVHRSYVHRNQGAQHIAREIAGADRTFTRSEASGLVRRLKETLNYRGEGIDIFELGVLRAKYKNSKSIYSMQLSDEEAIEMENRRKQYWRDKGKEPGYIIQASARVDFFNALRDAGLSYKDADKVMYG